MSGLGMSEGAPGRHGPTLIWNVNPGPDPVPLYRPADY